MIGVLLVLSSLALLMAVAYRGFNVILAAPAVAMLAVLLVDPATVAPAFSGLYMERLAGFARSYLPVFILGAVFGKLIEISGCSRSIVMEILRMFGPQRTILAIALVCALLTYGGVSLFVVVFAVYPFAVEMFRAANIPKRLIPGTIVLGAFTFTMDALPGTPQIQNLIPTTFFGTDAWAAPVLGCLGAAVIAVGGLSYLEWRRRVAQRSGEGYGSHPDASNAAEATDAANPDSAGIHPLIAIVPLLVVGVANRLLTSAIPFIYGTSHDLQLVS